MDIDTTLLLGNGLAAPRRPPSRRRAAAGFALPADAGAGDDDPSTAAAPAAPVITVVVAQDLAVVADVPACRAGAAQLAAALSENLLGALGQVQISCLGGGAPGAEAGVVLEKLALLAEQASSPEAPAVLCDVLLAIRQRAAIELARRP